MFRRVILVLVPLALARAEPVPIETFVRGSYVHGFPYTAALAYSGAEVPRLRALLSDPKEAPHAPVAVTMLALLGGDAVVGELGRFIEGGSGTLTPLAYKTRRIAVKALGLAAHRGSARALAWLRARASAADWRSRKLRWSSPGHDPAARDRDLAAATVVALALSGRPEAGITLATLRPGGGALVEAAIAEHARIARSGLAEYLTGR
jgi:hypothetical protein